MKRNKIFSPSLLLEGIKQTKVIGICFVIISLMASCAYPILRLISYVSMSNEELNIQPDFTIGFKTFILPTFIMQYLIPITMIFFLFSFMNSRKASDFYHSIPLSRNCVYITYTAVTLIWSLAIIITSTFLSYLIYACTPKIIISLDFIWPTIISSFVLAMLTTSVALIAKGLSGTIFTNIVISCIIMFLPRAIIFLYTASVNSAVKIADVSFMSFADIGNNIAFAPFAYYTKLSNTQVMPFNNAGTLWYSAILAIVYFALGFVLHKFRKSETAGRSSSYKAVQMVIRILLGAIPLLLISVAFASGQEVVSEIWFIGIVISLLIYFLYELITTKSAKKLLTAIPFYAISVVLNIIFILLCLGARDAIINDIPQISDISSVSITSDTLYQNDWYYADNYYKYKTQNLELKDKELINILQSSLVENVEKVKAGESLYGDKTEQFEVIYHCTSGRNIKRTVYVNNVKYGMSNGSVVRSQLEKNEAYLKSITSLPTDKEIGYISFDQGYDSGFTEQDIKDLWSTYKEEYSAASNEDKAALSSYGDYSDYTDIIPVLAISGYVGVNDFTEHYLIIPEITPKTYNKLINSHMSNCIRDGIVSRITSSVNNTGNIFMLYFIDVKEPENYFMMTYSNENLNTTSSVEGSFERYGLNYSGIDIDKKYLPELCNIVNIITSSVSDNVDINNGNLIQCGVVIVPDFEYDYDENGNIIGYSGASESEIIYVNITNEQYNEINNILKKVCDYTEYKASEN